MQKIIFLTRTTQSWCRSKKYVKSLLGNHKTNTRVRCSAVPVWQAIPEYLSQKIESVQKRALKIIKPGEESYEELLRVSVTWRNYSQDVKNYVDNIWVKSKAQITN